MRTLIPLFHLKRVTQARHRFPSPSHPKPNHLLSEPGRFQGQSIGCFATDFSSQQAQQFKEKMSMEMSPSEARQRCTMRHMSLLRVPRDAVATTVAPCRMGWHALRQLA